MTTILRKTIEHNYKLREPILSSTKQINNAVSPYLAFHCSIKEFVFLLSCETFVLARDISIPFMLEDSRGYDKLIAFLLKRRDIPLRKLHINIAFLPKIQKELSKYNRTLSAYEYCMSDCYNHGTIFYFPRHTKAIRLTESELYNVPQQLKQLELFATHIHENVMILIGRAKELNHLRINNAVIAFCGFPALLVELSLIGTMTYDSNYQYDCPHLIDLKISSVDKLPEQFITSIKDNLETITITRDCNGLNDFLSRMTKLKELNIYLDDECIVDFSAIPLCIEEIDSNVVFEITRPLVCYINLKELTMVLVPQLEEILAVCPCLSYLELIIFSPELKEMSFTRQYTQVKNLKLNYNEDTNELFKPLDVFPNLEILIRKVDPYYSETTDFLIKEMQIESTSVLIQLNTKHDEIPIDRYVFYCQPTTNIFLQDFLLYPKAEQISLIINGQLQKYQIRDILSEPVESLRFRSNKDGLFLEIECQCNDGKAIFKKTLRSL
jgi:hypothetical protein